MLKMLHLTNFEIVPVFSFKPGGKESESFCIKKKHEVFSRYWLKKEGLVRALGIVAQTKELFALIDKEGSACYQN